jgi:hypothetical protein
MQRRRQFLHAAAPHADYRIQPSHRQEQPVFAFVRRERIAAGLCAVAQRLKDLCRTPIASSEDGRDFLFARLGCRRGVSATFLPRRKRHALTACKLFAAIECRKQQNHDACFGRCHRLQWIAERSGSRINPDLAVPHPVRGFIASRGLTTQPRFEEIHAKSDVVVAAPRQRFALSLAPEAALHLPTSKGLRT